MLFFEAYAAEVYSSLKPSAKGLVQIVHKYMADVLWKLTGSTFAAFPRLQTAIKALVRSAEGICIDLGYNIHCVWVRASH